MLIIFFNIKYKTNRYNKKERIIMYMNTEVPITKHPKLPDGVPLVASFNDDRNRLSYYFPLLNAIDGVRVPLTKFIPIDGSYDSYPQIEYRKSKIRFR
jgi:hypothetical protein